MRTELARQAAALLLASALGLASGLLYDLLRPSRRALPQPWAALTDLLYGLCAFTGLFFYAMSAGDGRLGLWELSAALLGFLLYLHALSPLLLPLFTAAAAILGKALVKLGKCMKKIEEKQKKCFQYWKDCYIMKRNEIR